MEKLIFYLTEEDKRKLQELASADGRTMAGALRWMINQEYNRLVISVPVIGTISEKGIKSFPLSFEKQHGRKPVAGIDYSDDAPMSQDEHDFLTGEGIYA